MKKSSSKAKVSKEGRRPPKKSNRMRKFDDEIAATVKLIQELTKKQKDTQEELDALKSLHEKKNQLEKGRAPQVSTVAMDYFLMSQDDEAHQMFHITSNAISFELSVSHLSCA